MNENKIKILLVEDEEFDANRVKKTLSILGDEIVVADIVSDGTKALSLVEQDPYKYDVVITDYQLAGGWSGEILINKIKKIRRSLQIIVITKMTTNITDFEFANSLLRAGAFWYCTKYPNDVTEYIYQPTDFILSIRNAYAAGLLEEAARETNEKLNKSIEEQLHQQKLIGESAAVKLLLSQIELFAVSDSSVVISGPSGTGKEMVAHNIHLRSNRRYEKFVTINCGSLPSELIESELFGYEKWAFTGALKDKKGLLEIADKGSVFLDEIGELPHPAQVKLLRFLESGEIDKIGRTEKKTVNVRVISATNKDLRTEVKLKRFREDLYYRLSTINIYTPGLTERVSDIPVLLHHFLKFYSYKMNRKTPVISDAGIKLLTYYSWPGNVRELQSFVQRIMFLNKEAITDDDVKISLGIMLPKNSYYADTENFFDPSCVVDLKTFKEKMTEKYIRFVLQYSKNDSEAAAKLGMAPSNFYRLCQQLGLKD